MWPGFSVNTSNSVILWWFLPVLSNFWVSLNGTVWLWFQREDIMLDDCCKVEHARHVPTMFVFRIGTPRKIVLKNAYPVWPTGQEVLKCYIFEAKEITSMSDMFQLHCANNLHAWRRFWLRMFHFDFFFSLFCCQYFNTCCGFFLFQHWVELSQMQDESWERKFLQYCYTYLRPRTTLGLFYLWNCL